MFRNDYRQPSVRTALGKGTPNPGTYVKLWIDFYDLFAKTGLQNSLNAGTTYGDVWNYLSALGGNYNVLEVLDKQIALANQEGIYVLLTVYHRLPIWATDAAKSPATGKERGLPDVFASESKWSWLISYLYARYRQGAAVNMDGPRQSGYNQYGNPYGAWAWAIEFVNEPNRQFSPNDSATISPYLVEMFKIADNASQFWGGTSQHPVTLGPALDDSVSNIQDVCNRVTASLQPYTFKKPVGWSHHSYYDCKYGGTARFDPIVSRLSSQGWDNGARVFITETGFDASHVANDWVAVGTSVPQQDPASVEMTAQGESDQNVKVAAHYRALAPKAGAVMLLNHSVNDTPTARKTDANGNVTSDTFLSAINKVWWRYPSGNPATDAPTKRTFYDTWQSLPSKAAPA